MNDTIRWQIGIAITISVFMVMGLGFVNSGQDGRVDKLSTEVHLLRNDLLSRQAEQVVFLKIVHLRADIDRKWAREIAKIIHSECIRYKVDADLVVAIMRWESYFEVNAKTDAGAQGLMQVRRHWGELHGEENLFDPATNVKRALYILKVYLHMYQQDLKLALAAYNCGENPVNTALMKGLDPTNQYVTNVLGTYEELGALN